VALGHLAARQDGGVAGTVSNLVFLALLGAAAEQVDRRPAVLARYLTGGLVGQLTGTLWQPVGAGNSVAVCGLVGVLACALSGTRVPPWTGSAVALWLGALLATLWMPLIALGVVGAAVDRAVLRPHPRVRGPVALPACAGVAAVLTARHNVHGPALAVGTLLGALPAGGGAGDPAHTRADEVMTVLLAREPLFHRAELGTDRASFEAMTADDFREVGASGRVYDRNHVLDVLDRRMADPPVEAWSVTDPGCRALGPDTYLVTYLLDLDGRITRRATVWRHTATGWQVLYHQGTVVSADGADGAGS
jgi:hypothetical protein